MNVEPTVGIVDDPFELWIVEADDKKKSWLVTYHQAQGHWVVVSAQTGKALALGKGAGRQDGNLVVDAVKRRRKET